MIRSIEGKRGLRAHRPPYVAQVGLFGRPTLEQNVGRSTGFATSSEKGAAWRPRKAARAQRLPQLLGVRRVKKPAWCWRLRASPRANSSTSTAAAWSMANTQGLSPGGASGGILPASMAAEPLDFGPWKNTAASSAPTPL